MEKMGRMDGQKDQQMDAAVETALKKKHETHMTGKAQKKCTSNNSRTN